jgi:hypothetical protein
MSLRFTTFLSLTLYLITSKNTSVSFVYCIDFHALVKAATAYIVYDLY